MTGAAFKILQTFMEVQICATMLGKTVISITNIFYIQDLFSGTKLFPLERALSFAVIIKIGRQPYSKPGIGFTWQPLSADSTQPG